MSQRRKAQFIRFALVLGLAAAFSGVAGCQYLADLTPVDTTQRPIAQTYAPYFPVGAAVSSWQLKAVETLVSTQFSQLTCENAMKMSYTQASEGTFTFGEADRVAEYARQNKKRMVGHTLLWHHSTPSWVFEGLTPGQPDTIQTLRRRLKTHIEAVVRRYADVVENWDVVNEVISDDTSKLFRDQSEGSRWHAYFGGDDDAGREYVYWAFRYTKDVLESIRPGFSKGKLYLNDYNVVTKYKKILRLLKWLDEEKGLKVDGVGLQGHWSLSWPAVGDIRHAIDAIVAAGYSVKISELDVSIYHDYAMDGSFSPQPERVFTKELQVEQAHRYGALFELFREQSKKMTSVTLWGVADDSTWLNAHPVAGRKNYPLLFGTDHQPKAAVFAILNFEP
ncbi:MAG: hypothetical protein EP343_00175 [Deltaproteobacteria bacterium]|nr:MAG: hypothetical protein EP343_00175 [Deltaproteobacteria bacterium]